MRDSVVVVDGLGASVLPAVRFVEDAVVVALSEARVEDMDIVVVRGFSLKAVAETALLP